MKKLLSITLLIIAVLLGSCKEESSISRIEKGTTKKVKALSYTFNSTQNEEGGTVKSGTSTDSTKVLSPLERKVLSVETLELGGETFVASLIEENDPIDTKAKITQQEVSGSSVYTFYAYKDSEIKPQSITGVNKTIEVPVDENTNYGMLFLSSADGMNNPKEVNILPTAINKTNKEIIYNAKFNENVCYASFDRGSMPDGSPIDITFKPVFSQLGISVPSEVEGTTITVEKVRLVSGGQQEATVKVSYNSNATNNIDVSYDNTLADYPVVLEHNLNSTDKITYLYPNGKEGYYNIIPNKNPAKVSIEITAAKGGVTGTKTEIIEFKDATTNKPISFTCGKRYTIKITNIVPVSIVVEPNPLNIVPGKTGDLKVTKVKMSDGSEITPTTGFTWKIENPNGVVTNLNGEVVSPSPQILTGNTSTTANTISLTAKADYYGSTTVTVTYGGVSTTAKVNVYRDIPTTEYYMWDAPVGGYFRLVYPNFNYNNITSGVASRSCKGAPTLDNIKKYLGAGVYWVEDGPPFKDVNGNIHCKGLLVMKLGKIDFVNLTTSVTPKKDFFTDKNINKSDYFFLPACGHYCPGVGGAFSGAGIRGYFWPSTPYPNADFYVGTYCLRFASGYAVVNIRDDTGDYSRGHGMLPMPRL